MHARPRSRQSEVSSRPGLPRTPPGEAIVARMARRNAQAAGGAAAAAGADYQNTVAAWFAVRVLAETEVHPDFGLPVSVTYETVRVQTGQRLDDVGIDVVDRQSRERGHIFVQAKSRLRASTGASSDLAKALKQCVQQFLAERPGDLDRFVIATRDPGGLTVAAAVLDRNRIMPRADALDRAAATEAERRVLNLLRRHVVDAWTAERGHAPSDDDLRAVFRSIWFLELDGEPGGAGEREGLDRLRSSVLSAPDDDENAWAKLVRHFGARIVGPTGSDRQALQELLSATGVGVRAPRSVRASVEALRRYTARALARLGVHEQIRVAGGMLHIPRAVAGAIANLAEADSLLITGAPGVGKSGALVSALAELANREVDVVVIAADSITSSDEPTFRAELEIDRRLPEVLAEWPGSCPGVLAIDGLDAVRGSPRERVLVETIREVAQSVGRWRVIASIREYDLRYSALPALTSTRSARPLAQVLIRPLSDADLALLAGPAPVLHRLATEAGSPLAELLGVPFNLQLAAELVYGATVPPHELTPVRSQLGLLDMFWRFRVVGTDTDGNARERVVRDAARVMLEARRLTVPRQALVDGGIDGPALEQVLSAGVMTEWQTGAGMMPSRDTLGFAHHVLFDYAASRLFRSGDDALPAMLAADRGLAVLLRPSILFHVHHLWDSLSTAEFWAAVLRFVGTDEVPELAKVVPATVIAKDARRLDEVRPLIAALQATDLQRSSEALLAHVVNSILADDEAQAMVLGPGAGPWIAMCAEIGSPRSPSVAQSVSQVLQLAADDDVLTPEQLASAGPAARALLAYALRDPGRFPPLLKRAVKAVCRTAYSDLVATEAALSPLVERPHLAAWGHLDLDWLADGIPPLATAFPDLVLRLYVEAFGYEETSDEPTAMGPSRIMPMRSNRRQDYAGGLFRLAERFEAFLRAAPVHAFRGLEAAIQAERRRWTRVGQRDREFMFLGHRVVLRRDDSGFWDQDALGSRDARSMLDAFERVADEGADRGDGVARMRLLAAAADGAQSAAVWRRLLRLGARHPRTWGLELVELVTQPAILLCGDTTDTAVGYLAAVFPTLSRVRRTVVERALLSLPGLAPDYAEQAASIRDRVLAALEPGLLATGPARERRCQLDAQRAARRAEEHPEPGAPEQDTPAEGPITAARAEVGAARADVSSTEAPTPEQLQRLVTSLEHVRTLLGPPNGPDAAAEAEAWAELAIGGETWAQQVSVPTQHDLDRVGALLEEASWHPFPTARQHGENREHVSWSPSDARIPAAAGLAALARRGKVSPRVQALAVDSSAAVRFQVVNHLGDLMGADRPLAHEIAERTAREETNFDVLRALLHSMGYLMHVEREWAVEVVASVFERFVEDRSSDGPRAEASRLLAVLRVHFGNERATSTLEQLVAAPDRYSEELGAVVSALRAYVTRGAPGDGEAETSSRKRTLCLLRAILVAVRDRTEAIVVGRSAFPDQPWPEGEATAWMRCMRVAAEVAQEVYFGSGAYDRDQHGPHTGPAGEDAHLERFYREGRDLLVSLASVGWPQVTHYLVDTLRALVHFDPLGVLELAATAIQRGNELGYHGETLAVTQVVKLVEDYLANHRGLLLANPQATAQLVDVLDGFASLGWEPALRLVYRLDEIYR